MTETPGSASAHRPHPHSARWPGVGGGGGEFGGEVARAWAMARHAAVGYVVLKWLHVLQVQLVRSWDVGDGVLWW